MNFLKDTSFKKLMRIFLVSDLHFERRKESITEMDWSFLSKWPEAEICILAGDIGSPLLRRDLLQELFFRLVKKYRVYYLPGNHEYYNYDHQTSKKEIEEMLEKMCIETGVQWLFRKTIPVDQQGNPTLEGKEFVRLIGTTLWVHPSPESFSSNTDVQMGKIFTSNEEIQKLHLEEFKFLQNELKKSLQAEKKVIVVTHHLPSYQMIHPRYQWFKGNDLFASVTLETLRDDLKNVLIWMCGHTHERVVIDKFKGLLENCSLIALTNPVGYQREPRVTSFSTDVVTLGSVPTTLPAK